MTWAEHVSRIGSTPGVSTKLGYTSEHLVALAEHLRDNPVIVGHRLRDTEPNDDEVVVSIPDYDSRMVYVRGKRRPLLVPMHGLKQIQIGIRELLRSAAEELLHPSCHGYRPNHSTLSNAAPHCGAAWIQKLDIKEFFGSTTTMMVATMLEVIGFDTDSGRLLAQLATVNNALPLGAPSSPVISNLMLATFDEEAGREASDRGITYTRYADDMTFSADEDFDLAGVVSHLLAARGYDLAPSKSVRARRGQNLTVTGLVTWDAAPPRLPKAFRRRLETELYFIERHGLEDHAIREYQWDWIDADEQPEKHVEQSAAHLRGKLMYAMGIQRTWTQALLARYRSAAKLVLGDTADATERRAERIAFMRQLAADVRSCSTAPAPRLVVP